jgi:hypothetical protein
MASENDSSHKRTAGDQHTSSSAISEASYPWSGKNRRERKHPEGDTNLQITPVEVRCYESGNRWYHR